MDGNTDPNQVQRMISILMNEVINCYIYYVLIVKNTLSPLTSLASLLEMFSILCCRFYLYGAVHERTSGQPRFLPGNHSLVVDRNIPRLVVFANYLCVPL